MISCSSIIATQKSNASTNNMSNRLFVYMSKKSPWAWVPTLYFAEGLPYVAVMTISLIMYKRLGLSNTDITLYTSGLYLPWVIKPLWSPFIDIIKTKRWWIVTMQLLIGAALGGVAFTIGAILYNVGKKKRYRHFIFHIFVVIGIVTQFIGVWWYLLLQR